MTESRAARPPLLEIQHATVYRGDTRVFDDLSLTIPAGRHTVILGPNGAGKSTLLKLITRELYSAPGGGFVRVLGRETWNVWQLRAHLGLVSHDLQHDYAADVVGRDVVLSGLHASIGTYAHQIYRQDDVSRADGLLHRLGIPHLAQRAFGGMSTGEQRRCLLARALIHDPHTLILDEPTSGLDLRGCSEYLATIRASMRDGRTIMLVTHHLHEIPPEVNQLVLLKAGRVVAQGLKKEWLTSESISDLFETPITLLERNGWYQPVPA
jgi:iron complex transport system ATP-binding protein